MLRAVLFDLYGVLGLNGWQAFKAKHFADRPEDWEHLRRLGQQADAGLATQDEFVAALVRATGESEATIRYQFESTRANKPLLDFIARDIKPGYKVGLLSNTSHDVYGSIFTTKELALFDIAIGSFSVGLTKPDPEMFLLACSRLELPPSECMMVDDKTEHLRAAQKLGMSTVRYVTVDQTMAAIREQLSR